MQDFEETLRKKIKKIIQTWKGRACERWCIAWLCLYIHAGARCQNLIAKTVFICNARARAVFLDNRSVQSRDFQLGWTNKSDKKRREREKRKGETVPVLCSLRFILQKQSQILWQQAEILRGGLYVCITFLFGMFLLFFIQRNVIKQTFPNHSFKATIRDLTGSNQSVRAQNISKQSVFVVNTHNASFLLIPMDRVPITSCHHNSYY